MDFSGLSCIVGQITSEILHGCIQGNTIILAVFGKSPLSGLVISICWFVLCTVTSRGIMSHCRLSLYDVIYGPSVNSNIQCKQRSIITLVC